MHLWHEWNSKCECLTKCSQATQTGYLLVWFNHWTSMYLQLYWIVIYSELVACGCHSKLINKHFPNEQMVWHRHALSPSSPSHPPLRVYPQLSSKIKQRLIIFAWQFSMCRDHASIHSLYVSVKLNSKVY